MSIDVIQLWDAETGRELIPIPLGNPARSLGAVKDATFVSLTFTPDGGQLLGVRADGSVQMWDSRPVERFGGPSPVAPLPRRVR